MDNFLKKMNSYFFVLLAFGLALAMALLPYYISGYIILGGEGNYVVDFKVLLYNYKYVWQNVMAGFHSPSLNFIYFNGFLFSFLQDFIHNMRVVNFIIVFMIYFLPFASMLLVCKELRATPALTFLTSYFYIVNPFSMCFFYSLNQWNSLALFIIPFFFWIIMKFYYDNIKLFLVFGLASSFFAFTNANPPLMFIYQLAILLMVVFIPLYQNAHFSLFQVIKKYLVLLSSFILFNIWWMLNWINIMEYIPKTYTKDYALNWAIDVSSRPNLLWRSFTFTGLIPIDSSENFLSALYSSVPGLLVSVIPFLIVLYFWLRQRFLNTIYCFFISILVITIFLMKGTAAPFGFIYKLMMLYVPFFNMFKTPVEKWGVLYTFFFTLLLIFVFKDSREVKWYKFLYGSFLIYLVFASAPFLTGKLISDYKMADGNISSRRYIDKPEYNDLREKLNNDQQEYRVLSLPGSLNYQVALFTDKDRFYTGMDPLLSNVNKQIITADHRLMGYFDSDILYDNIALNTFPRLLSIYNVGAIVINKDTHPWFGLQEKENMAELEHIFDNDKRYQKETIAKSKHTSNNAERNQQDAAISLYKVKKEYFLPRIYSATNISQIEDDFNPAIPLMYASYPDPAPAIVRKKDLYDFYKYQKLSPAQIDKAIEMERDAHTIQTFKKSSYLFYIDKEQINNRLKDKDELEETKLSGENPFELGKKNFYISKEGSYTVKAFIKPKRVFLARDFVKSDFVISNVIDVKPYSDIIYGWNIKALNTIFQQKILDDGVLINVYFQNKGDVNEGAVLTKKFSDINIKERPYLVFYSEMEDTGVQEIEIEIKLDEPNRNEKIVLKVDSRQYVVNLYEKVKAIFHGDKVNNLFIDEVLIRFKKRDGIDLSNKDSRHFYPFIFKNMVFLKSQPILADFEDRLSAYRPGTYYYFEKDGGLRNVDFFEQVPQNVKDIYNLQMQRFINLKDTPVLSFSFLKPALTDGIDGERKRFPSEWKVVLGLDFDGDEIEDDSIVLFLPGTEINGNRLLLTMRAYEEAEKRFPNKKYYNLISVGISHSDDKEMLYQNVMGKKLIRYREYTYKHSDSKADVIEIDGKTYKSANIKEHEGQEVNTNGEDRYIEFATYLKNGGHILNVPEHDEFKVEMVEIKPKVKTQGSPEIEFQKINPTRYVVDVKGAKEPFILVFSESFHDKWEAYVRQRPEVRGQRPEENQKTEQWSALWGAWKDRGKRIEIKDHFVINGYANGWIVPVVDVGSMRLEVGGAKSEVEGKRQEAIGEDFQIVLEYKTQRLFEAGVLISASTLLGCIGCLGYGLVRRKKN